MLINIHIVKCRSSGKRESTGIEVTQNLDILSDAFTTIDKHWVTLRIYRQRFQLKLIQYTVYNSDGFQSNPIQSLHVLCTQISLVAFLHST